MKSVWQCATVGTVAWALLTGAGCARKPEITELQRKQAAHLASEAQFALTMRDLAGAETSLARAVELAPDEGALWVTLGATRLKQGKRDAAKAAYEGALEAYEDAAKEHKTDPEPWLKQVHVLALLGRTDDARSRLERAAKQFPDSRHVRLFVEGRQLDRMLADPMFKDMAL